MDFLADLRRALPEGAVLTGDDKAPFEVDWRGIHHHPALAAVLPASVAQVAAVVRLCARYQVAVVPQGGNTGLVAGGVPVPHGPQIVLSLRRLRRIRDLDPACNTVTVEAGLTLAEVQAAAAERGLLFPVSFAAEGSAQIGGAIATNAGGLQVLSYGSMRAQVLGLEVVLADGRIWNGLRRLRKDNTGFDLKQLFIGGEGLLGVITAACLALRPAVAAHATALAALASVEAALDLFGLLRAKAGQALTMCEFISAPALRLALRHAPPAREPPAAAAYLLAELSGQGGAGLSELLEQALEVALERGLLTDAVIAQNERERGELIALREGISDAELAEGGAVKHDIAVPVSRLPETIRAIEAKVAEAFPECRLNIFGHLGDGNLHVNVRPPPGKTLADLQDQAAVTSSVEDIAVAHEGSFSAEHGIGQMRIAGMAWHKSAVELEMMRRLKRAFDPDCRFNPGKMLP